MNDNDIIRMALEHFGAVLKPSDLEVQLAVLAVAAEREACAKLCDELRDEDGFEPYGTECAAAIRARSEA